MCHLFDSMTVLPILVYGSELWGPKVYVHLRFCKFLLHVSACNLACYGELGRYPFELRGKPSVIKYWYRLVTDWSLLSESYQLSLSIPKSWCSEVKGIVDNLGFPEVWLYPVWASSVNDLSERPVLRRLVKFTKMHYWETENLQTLQN